MEYHGNILCLSFDELVPRIIKSKGTYDSLANRNSINIVRRGGGAGVCALIEYETLPVVYKNEVLKVYGNPHEVIANQPIKDRVVRDIAAEKYYRDYILPTGSHLPDGILPNGNYDATKDHINKYTIAASWLNMLRDLTADKKYIKKELGMQMADFWKNIALLIGAENIDLPKNRIRLKEKISQYVQEGYKCLVVESRYGNDNSKKVKDELAEALLLELCAHPNKHDDVMVMRAYNEWASQNNRELIKSKSTVGNWRRSNDWQIKKQRDGVAANYNKYGTNIKRKRPSAPLLLVESDDNDLDLFFMEIKDRNGTNYKNYYKRFTVMVVIDPFNDYILGWAMGESQTQELVKAAYQNAVLHVAELTGKTYLPHQIRSDRFGLKSEDLLRFYQSVATYTPAAARAPRGKYIERSFGKEWHRVLKLYDNYAGSNITSKTRLNPDNVNAVRKNFPTAEEAPAIIAEFINRMRQYKGRQMQWITAFHNSEKSKERAIGAEEMLLLFGKRHLTRNGEEGNTITNDGINITVGGIKYNYDIPEAIALQNIGRKVQVIYEERDMSRVLITDGHGLREVIYEPDLMPSAIADYQDGDGKRLREQFNRKSRELSMQDEAGNKRKIVLEAGGLNAQSLLQAGVLDKGIKQEAQHTYISQTANGGGFEPVPVSRKEQKPTNNNKENDENRGERADDDLWNAM